MSEFNCTKCGLCCAQIGKMVEKARKMDKSSPIIKAMADFPHEFDKNGRCEKLRYDNTCAVYSNRPTICNVEKTRSEFFKSVSQEQFYELNYSECKRLQEQQT